MEKRIKAKDIKVDDNIRLGIESGRVESLSPIKAPDKSITGYRMLVKLSNGHVRKWTLGSEVPLTEITSVSTVEVGEYILIHDTPMQVLEIEEVETASTNHVLYTRQFKVVIPSLNDSIYTILVGDCDDEGFLNVFTEMPIELGILLQVKEG